MKTRSIAVPLEDRESRRAASRATVNVCVTAGAGTGKTTLLVETALARVLLQGRRLSRLLMLTFTEKAANEMRLRLGRAIESLLVPRTEDDRDRRARWEAEGTDVEARLKAAHAGIDRAEIGTIHSFCAHVLREHPIEAGVDPSFAVDEGGRLEAMFRREWPAWLDRELAAGSPRRTTWLRVLEKVNLWELEAVARSLASFEAPDEALDPNRSTAAGESRLKAFREGLVARIDAAVPTCADPKNKLRLQLAEAAAYLREPDKRKPPPWKYLSNDTRGWPDWPEVDRLADDARRLVRLIAACDPALGRDVLTLMSDFAKGFRRAYTAEGFVSFDGLLGLVRDLLRSERHADVRERLKGKYDAILVDEFQDTDPAQGEILLMVGEQPGTRSPDPRKVQLAPGKLFIVGDPKQSIYSFRGADIVSYGDVKKMILAQGGREEFLRTNFRSHHGIIAVVNGVFRTVIREAGELQPKYEPINPLEGRVPTMPSQTVELSLFEGEDDEDFKAADARRAEAAWIARRLKHDLDRVEIPDAEGRTVKLQKRHVAILFKALPDVHIYLEALRAADIAYVVEGEKYFYGTTEVVDFTNLLRAVADPQDRIAVAGLLRSPLGGMDDRALFGMRKALDYRERREGEPRIFAALRELHGLAGTMPVAELIDRAFVLTCALEVASAQSEQAVANLLKLRQMAHAMDAHGGLTLRQFTARAKESVRELEEEGESPLADETLDAVRVLSIHKAKGLEFPVVFLPDLHRQFFEREERPPAAYDWPTQTLGLCFGKWNDAGGAALAWHESLRRREEARRVLYVAMTRAREALILTGAADFKRDASNLGLLSEAVPELLAGSMDEERVLRAGDGEVRVARRQGEREFQKAKRAKSPPKLDADALGRLAAAWAARREEFQKAASTPRFTSPTLLRAQGGATQGFADASERDEDEGRRGRAAAVGTLCHRVLQLVDFKKPEIAKLIEHCCDDPAIAAEARAVLEGFVRTAEFRELAGGRVIGREMPFLLREGGTIVQGVIDLVVQIGGKTVVIDYKSDEVREPDKFGAQKFWYLKAVESVMGVKDAEFRIVWLRALA